MRETRGRRLFRWGILALAAAAVVGCDGPRGDVVAEAEGHELTIDQLTEVVAQGKAVLLEEEVVGRVADLWVDYMLFARRIAEDDDLLDSAMVVLAMWGDARQLIVDHYHDELLEGKVALTDEAVDSAYAAGDHRIIHHILFRTPPDMSPPDKAAQKQKADRLRERVASGRLGWERANEQNEDFAVKSSGGSLGLLARGATVPPFEQAAFALAPGELSTVTTTSYGYHIIRRPPLEEVRGEFTDGLETLLIEQADSVFLGELESRWEVAVRDDAPELMRKAAEDLRPAKRSRKVVGTYRGGRFTVSDLAHWLQTLDVRYQGQIARADDASLTEFARALMRNHLLVIEAEAAGHALNADDIAELTEMLTERLTPLRELMGLDSALNAATVQDERYRIAEAQVLEYLGAVTQNMKSLATVPAFLSDKLRDEGDWGVSRSAVGRVVERATVLRSELGRVDRAPETADSVADSAVGEARQP